MKNKKIDGPEFDGFRNDVIIGADGEITMKGLRHASAAGKGKTRLLNAPVGIIGRIEHVPAEEIVGAPSQFAANPEHPIDLTCTPLYEQEFSRQSNSYPSHAVSPELDEQRGARQITGIGIAETMNQPKNR